MTSPPSDAPPPDPLQAQLEAERLQAVIEGANVGTWEVNAVTGTMRADERWAAITGFTLAELDARMNDDWRSMVHPDDLPQLTVALRRHFTGQAPYYQCEYRQIHKTDGWIWVYAHAKVVKRAPDGSPLLLAGTIADISARKRAEARVLELNESLERRVLERTAQLEAALQELRRSQDALARSEAKAALGIAVASVSHELGTPLGNGLMTASTLQAQTQAFARQLAGGALRRSQLQEFVTQVGEGSQLLLRNLERAAGLLRNFRQVAADQASGQRRSFDLRVALREVLDTLAPLHSKQPHRVELSVAEGIVMDSYPGPLGQVVINLVNNAYIHAFDPARPGLLTITAEQEDDKVRLTLADNGRGIEPHVLDKMFEPFFSTRIGHGGTGLGMSIVDSLVKKPLGGTLAVTSKPGEGTLFTLLLPLNAPSATTVVD